VAVGSCESFRKTGPAEKARANPHALLVRAAIDQGAVKSQESVLAPC
jgi:hypothetical protein